MIREEVRKLIADRLVTWAYRLDPDRFMQDRAVLATVSVLRDEFASFSDQDLNHRALAVAIVEAIDAVEEPRK